MFKNNFHSSNTCLETFTPHNRVYQMAQIVYSFPGTILVDQKVTLKLSLRNFSIGMCCHEIKEQFGKSFVLNFLLDLRDEKVFEHVHASISITISKVRLAVNSSGAYEGLVKA